MTRKQIAALACEELEKIYPDVECSLVYDKPYELMFAARLAAQCTDARVNIVTKTLFVKYPDLEAFANADIAELEEDIKPCGFYHTKAKSLKEMAQQLLNDFGGEVPQTMEELLTLSGIGRKTANLVMGDIFGKPAVVTDTDAELRFRPAGLFCQPGAECGRNIIDHPFRQCDAFLFRCDRYAAHITAVGKFLEYFFGY